MKTSRVTPAALVATLQAPDAAEIFGEAPMRLYGELKVLKDEIKACHSLLREKEKEALEAQKAFNDFCTGFKKGYGLSAS